MVQYLDDYIAVGLSGLPVCQRNLDEMLSHRRLGVLVAPANCEGPAIELVFLNCTVRNFPTPVDVKALQLLVGLASYY